MDSVLRPKALPYLKTHKNDLWNPPAWALHPNVSLSIGKAAKRLGVSIRTLNRHADEWGFTVLRRFDDRRYFLISELDDYIKRGKELDADAIKRARKEDRNALETISGKKRRTKGKGRDKT